MIVSLRGASGSGKTTAAYELLKAFPAEPLYVPTYRLREGPDGMKTITEDGKPKTPRAFRLPGDLYVIGRYTGAACSGCDGWKPQLIDAIARYYAKLGHVFVEALIMSSAVKTWLQLSADFPRQVVFAYIDTDQDTCIRQVYLRNGGRPIKEHDLRSHWRSINAQRKRLEEAGERAVTVRHGYALADLVALFRSGGWDPYAKPRPVVASVTSDLFSLIDRKMT